MRIIFLIALLVVIPTRANASTIQAKCDDLIGSEYHYLNGKFQYHNDAEGQPTLSKPVVIYNTDSKRGIFTITDAVGNQSTDKLMAIGADSHAISLIGTNNNWPELLTLYLPEQVLMYSDQGLQALPNGSTPRGTLFYAKCKISIE